MDSAVRSEHILKDVSFGSGRSLRSIMLVGGGGGGCIAVGGCGLDREVERGTSRADERCLSSTIQLHTKTIKIR